MLNVVAFGLVFLVVVAGGSLRQKGRWSTAAYRGWVVATALLCALGILLGWYANHQRVRTGDERGRAASGHPPT